MSESSGLSLNDYMHEVRRHLSRYCVSLSYEDSAHPSPEKWKYGTGILLRRGVNASVITAGHLASEVHALKAQGRLGALHVRYTHVSNDLTTHVITPDEITEQSLVVAQDIDAAQLHLSPELTSAIERHDNHFFATTDFMRGTTTERHLALVCGYPVQANIVTRNEALVVRQGQGWLRYDHVRLGSLAFQSTLVTKIGEDNAILQAGFDCEADEHAFRPFLGNINSHPESKVTSAVGMSGGPVLAIVVDAENADMFFEPRLLGMQSSQKYIEWQDRIEITQLTAVSSAALLKWIEP